VLVGAALGVLLMWVAVTIFGLLAVWSPFPSELWKTHSLAVTFGSEAIAFLPMAVLLGYFLAKLFATSRVANALISATLALAVCCVGSFSDSTSFVDRLLEVPALTISLILVTPVAVRAFERMRSNYRLERP
jgi:hypothetical protein